MSIIFFIIALIGLFISNAKYESAKKMRVSMMICPNCGSGNVKIRKEISGITGSGLSSYGNRWGVHTGVRNINRQRIGVCQKCGYDYPYISLADIKHTVKEARSMYYFWLTLTVIAAGVWIWGFLH